MRTSSQLVKLNVLAFIEPIRDGVQRNNLMCKFVMQHFQRLIVIDLTYKHFII